MPTHHSDDERVRSMARAVVEQFGPRGLDVAERQVALSTDDEHAADVWRHIATVIQNDQSNGEDTDRSNTTHQQRAELRMISDSPADMRAFLARLLLRSELTPEAQRAILALKPRVMRTPSRQDIVMPGQTLDHACLVVSGLLARFDQVLAGDRQITAIYVPGDMCDLHSVVVPATAWGLTALSAVVSLQVPHSALRALAAEHPQIAQAFWRDTVADASILAKWISNLGRKSALARLSHLLCEIGMRLELAGVGDRTSYTFDVTQEQLGNMLGLTAVHVNRMLLTLRTDNVATARGHRVEISNWAKLAAIGEFDPDFLLLPREREAA